VRRSGRAVVAAACAALCACAGATSRGREPISPPSWDEAANATYTGIEEDPVALSGGVHEGEPFVPGGASRPRLALVPGFWLSGDLEGDGAPEAIVLLDASSGGSGTNVYVAALSRDGSRVVERGTAHVGDRVQVRGARVDGDRVVLDVVQAGPTDALCCPGEKATRAFGLEGEALVEVESRTTGRLSPGEDLAGVEWLLVEQNGKPVAADPEQTLVVDGTRVRGQGGCNSYFGALREGATPGELAIGPIGATRMACEESVMDQETRYLAALEHAAKFGFVAGRLALTSRQGDRLETLIFRARPLSPP
jgi:heat shock protein HslJ